MCTLTKIVVDMVFAPRLQHLGIYLQLYWKGRDNQIMLKLFWKSWGSTRENGLRRSLEKYTILIHKENHSNCHKISLSCTEDTCNTTTMMDMESKPNADCDWCHFHQLVSNIDLQSCCPCGLYGTSHPELLFLSRPSCYGHGPMVQGHSGFHIPFQMSVKEAKNLTLSPTRILVRAWMTVSMWTWDPNILPWEVVP